MSGLFNVLVVTRAGLVSILTGLSEEVAREAAQRLSGLGAGDVKPWSDSSIAQSVALAAWARLKPPYRVMRAPPKYGADLDRIEAWGPDGALEIWPRPADYDERVDAISALSETVTDDEWITHFSVWGAPTDHWLASAREKAAQA